MNLRQVAEKAAVKAQERIAEMKAQGKQITRYTPIAEFGADVREGRVSIQEMIGTSDGSAEFLEKITFDLYQGREQVPLLYKGIYQERVDANFPKTMVAEEFGPVQVVFLEKFEGGEVKFGSLGPGTEKVVKFATYAAGVEYDEDIVEYNQTWRVSEIGVAFGEAYNKLLNHLHLSPIISGSYTTTGGGLAAQKAKQEADTSPAAQLIAFATDVKTTLSNAIQVLPNGTTLIANSADKILLENAILGDILSDLTTPGVVKRTLSPDRIIYYDGATVKVGGKTYTYTGVTAGFCYLIVPKTQFVEYIKHDLRVDSGDGDLSRLILAQVVGRARRAVFAALTGKNGAVKIDIYA